MKIIDPIALHVSLKAYMLTCVHVKGMSLIIADIDTESVAKFHNSSPTVLNEVI